MSLRLAIHRQLPASPAALTVVLLHTTSNLGLTPSCRMQCDAIYAFCRPICFDFSDESVMFVKCQTVFPRESKMKCQM